MPPNRRRFLKYLAKLFDLCTLVASVVIAMAVFALPTGMTLAGFMAMRIRLGNCLVFVLLLLVWHIFFSFCGMYTSQRLTKPLTQIAEVCKATTLAPFFQFVSARTFHLRIVTLTFVLTFLLS